jgi:hypothetical protein
MRRIDKSIESANIPSAYRRMGNYDASVHRCMVIRRYFTDDNKNVTKGSTNQVVTYDCIVIGGPKDGIILDSVRDASSLGGQYNYSEQIWRPVSKVSFTPERGAQLEEQDGDIVYVSFLNGNKSFPVIIGGDKQALNEEVGATKQDGPRMLFQYNGIHVLIDKDGQLFFTRKAGEIDSELREFVPDEENDPKVKVSFEGDNVLLEDDGGNRILIDAENQKIFIETEAEFEINTQTLKMIADAEFSVETSVANITASAVNINASTTNISGNVFMGGGGPGVARIGDRAVGTGNKGRPVVSTIISGSGNTFSS